jgi:hypothetical protein
MPRVSWWHWPFDCIAWTGAGAIETMALSLASTVLKPVAYCSACCSHRSAQQPAEEGVTFLNPCRLRGRVEQ